MAKKKPSKKKATKKKVTKRKPAKPAQSESVNSDSDDQIVENIRIIKLDGAAGLESLRESPATTPRPIEMPIRSTEEYSENERTPKGGEGLESVPTEDDDISLEMESAPPRAITTASADTRRVTNMSSFPFSAVGRVDVDYQGPNGAQISGSGSGWVVGERTVYTAAHVVEPTTVFNGRTFRISRITFRPQFPSGVRAWNGVRLFVHNEYFSEPRGNLVFDLAAFVVDTNDDAVAPVTGKLGSTNPTSFPVRGTGIGYPADPPTVFGFDGNTMWQSSGPITRDSFANFNRRRNDMTRGCSGGPWVVSLGGATGFRAVGLNSHVRNATTFNPMISPVFDDDYLSVIRRVQGFERALNVG